MLAEVRPFLQVGLCCRKSILVAIVVVDPKVHVLLRDARKEIVTEEGLLFLTVTGMILIQVAICTVAPLRYSRSYLVGFGSARWTFIGLRGRCFDQLLDFLKLGVAHPRKGAWP